MSDRLLFNTPYTSNPDFVQDCLQSFLRMRREALAMQAEEGHTWDLRTRIAFRTSVLPMLDQWIYDARAWLAARRIPCRKGLEGAA